MCKWPKLVEPDSYQDGPKKYKINVYLDAKGRRELNESGARLRVKEDDDGKYVQFSRPVEKTIKDEAVTLGPPWVLINKDGEEVDFDDPSKIGNGSIVTCKVSVYDTRMGKGHTLEAVRVDDLKEYVPEENKTEGERKF
jgi:hypothetical protein